MIRSLIFALFFLLDIANTTLLSAQVSAEHKALVKHVKNTPVEIEQDITALHAYLSAAGETDSIQLTSYFLWITQRIRYDQEVAMAIDKRPRKPSIRQTLRSRRAICTGYAQLLKVLCKKSNIPCEIVNGYTKNFPTSKPTLEEPDHAWNAIKINEKWYLLDATWAAGIAQNPKGFPYRDAAYYFLANPRRFLEDHLPSDPMWQLLDCPLRPSEFQQSPSEIALLWNTRDTCFSLADSLTAYEQLSPADQQLRSLQRAYDANPNASNAQELGQAYLDQFIHLEDQESALQSSGDMEALLQLYPRLLAIADRAKKYIELYDWQKENLAYSHLNFAVALSRQLPDLAEGEATQKSLQTMQKNLLKAQGLLQSLPPSPFVQRGLDTCKEYLSFTHQKIKPIAN